MEKTQKEQANAIRAKLSIYMNFVRENIDDISDKNKNRTAWTVRKYKAYGRG